ncbi:MAG: regulatory protein RecX [Legionellales bacterium]|nr:regulatory protein RecX [Legionellales bacterium]
MTERSSDRWRVCTTHDASECSEKDVILNSIKTKALDLLARREHSRQELRRKLQRRFDDLDLIEIALNQLSESDYLSESRFVEAYIRFRANKGFGPAHIRQSLLQRGINRDLIEQFLFSSPDIDWRERAHDVQVKKYGKKPPATFAAHMKQIQFLRYRGFENVARIQQEEE